MKLLYDASYYANPSGISLSLERRHELLELLERWKEKQKFYVLEDAAYRDLRYEGEDLPSLWGLDATASTVLYAGTFSKPFAPGLKCGYVVVPEDLVEPLTFLKGNHDFGSANVTQQILVEVLETGTYDRHLTELRQRYRQKRDAMLRGLEEGLGGFRDQVLWTYPEGGLYVWVRLPDEVETGRDLPLFRRCLETGVLYVPGEFCYPNQQKNSPKSRLRLSFGFLPEAGIQTGIERFCRAVREELRGIS